MLIEAEQGASNSWHYTTTSTVYAMISLLVKASSRLTRRPVCPLKVQLARVKAHYVYYCIVHVGMVDQSRI